MGWIDCYFAGSSKSHRENWISFIFLESPHQVDMKNVVKFSKHFFGVFQYSRNSQWHPWIGRVMRTFSLTHIQTVAQLTSCLFYAVRNKSEVLGAHAPKGNIVNIAPNWCRYLFKYWEELREALLSKSDNCQNIIRLLLSKVRDRYIHVNLVIASIRSTHQVSFNHNTYFKTPFFSWKIDFSSTLWVLRW